jgi:hypothetical protein
MRAQRIKTGLHRLGGAVLKISAAVAMVLDLARGDVHDHLGALGEVAGALLRSVIISV